MSRHLLSRSEGRSAPGEALHRLEALARRDSAFAAALRRCETTEAAARVARRRGITISPEALWRHRGTLTPGGMPTWRG